VYAEIFVCAHLYVNAAEFKQVMEKQVFRSLNVAAWNIFHFVR
jgi:hypothetical protein